ncbi:hypothetical protein F2Q68_00007637 [Brassica cretica]|uniref:Cyclin-like domain-containing protein n=1 Tax=Brassica cretica TaxID=69181 RepID=A0A8S9L1T6_BRACR|nr:hypothetical protein F2Q68_00007637 [Brassica cretica]
MRGVLVDWLVEVAEEYKLLSYTLYLDVSYIDRFLSLQIVNRQKLQLLGVSSMLIASKYEEILPPNVEDFCYITDNTYTKQEIVKMAADLLLALQFELGNPTTNIYLRLLESDAFGGYGRDREGWKPVLKSSAFDGIPSSGSTNADSEPSIVSHKLRQGSSSSAMMNKQS